MELIAYFDESSCYRCVLCFSIGWCLQSTFYESEIIQLNQVQSQKSGMIDAIAYVLV